MRLQRWLHDDAPADVLMPVDPRTKAPLFRHAGGSWGWRAFDRWLGEAARVDGVGILLKTLCAVDVDCAAMVLELERRFPVLGAAPKETTARGAHFLFRRSALADEHGFYDSCSKGMAGVDFKTVTRTGTGGLLLVAPSPGKAWVRAPWTLGAVPEIPEDLLRAVAAPAHPPIDLEFRCKAGATVTVSAMTCAVRSPYIKMFLDADGAPTRAVAFEPFGAEAVKCAMEAMDAGLIDPANTALFSDICDVYGFACFPKADVSAVTDATRELISVHDLHPEMAFASARAECVPVDAGLAASLSFHLVDPGPAALFRGSAQPPRPPAGQRLLEPDPAAAVAAALPGFVAQAMREFPGTLVAAGGAVLGAVVGRVPAGADIDLYVVCSTEAEGNAIVRHLAAADGVETAAWTGYALTLEHADSEQSVQVILVLNRDAASVIRGFDLHPCRVMAAADADGVFAVTATTAWVEAVRTMSCPILEAYWTSSSTMRAAKYAAKGFVPYVPGLDRARVEKWKSAELGRAWHQRASGLLEALRSRPGLEQAFAAEEFVRRAGRRASAYDLLLPVAMVRRSDYEQAAQRSGFWHIVRQLWAGAHAGHRKPWYGRYSEADPVYWRVYGAGEKCHAVHLRDGNFGDWVQRR